MKSMFQWKFIPVARFTFKLPWPSSAAPLFHYSEEKIWVNNTAKNIIGVKMANYQGAFSTEQKAQV